MIQLAIRTGWTLDEVRQLSGREVVTILEELSTDG
tara:strand:+ start:2037 stop:2141 length:105 start_codon:yes stop_codon:yes gene_type:complete